MPPLILLFSFQYIFLICFGGDLLKDASKTKKIIKLFLTTLYISAFTFGGGFVIVTLLKKKVVDEYHWITDTEMLDITAMAESSPGAIAVNAAVLLGWKIAGFTGMLVAVTGTIIPPMIIITIVSYFYSMFASNMYVAFILKGMQAGVAAVILDVVFSLGKDVFKQKSVFNYLIFICAFLISFLTDVNIILVIIGAAVIGIIKEAITHGRKNNDDIS